MKREWQLLNLIMIRCMCHSLQLALSHAVQGTLLRNVDFLVQEVQHAKAYERKNVDPARLLEDLTLLIKTVCSKVLILTVNIDPLCQLIDGHLNPKPYWGYKFEKLANTLPAGPEVDLVCQHCIAFTVKLSALAAPTIELQDIAGHGMAVCGSVPASAERTHCGAGRTFWYKTKQDRSRGHPVEDANRGELGEHH